MAVEFQHLGSREGVGGQVETKFAGDVVDAILLDGPQGLGGHLDPYKALLLVVPKPLPLQVWLLKLFGAAVRVRDGIPVIGFFARDHAAARHKEAFITSPHSTTIN